MSNENTLSQGKGPYSSTNMAVSTFETAMRQLQESPPPPRVRYDCDPCIERSEVDIQVILHGSKNSLFWEQAAQAIVQTCRSMRVNLLNHVGNNVPYWDDHESGSDLLYDEYNPSQMVEDIRKVTQQYRQQSSNQRGHALIVSLPTAEVEEAAQQAIAAGVPVFGMNTGYDRAQELGLLTFVAMDEFKAGQAAGQEILRMTTDDDMMANTSLTAGDSLGKLQNTTKVLYINHEWGNFALEQRRNGLEDVLEETSASKNASFEVVELVISDSTGEGITEATLSQSLEGCPYHAIVSGQHIGQSVVEAIQSACGDGDEEKHVIKGVFDTSEFVYRAIAVGDVDFAISQQHWLQSSVTAAMASLFASSTGMHLQYSVESNSGTYLSGPEVLTLQSGAVGGDTVVKQKDKVPFPTDTQQTCEEQAFPICTVGSEENNAERIVDGDDECPCFDRRKLTIAVVSHGTETEDFWVGMRSAAQQAALDMNVELDWELFSHSESNQALHNKMASQMISKCQSGVDGMVVSIPSEVVELAIRTCVELNIPTISINANSNNLSQKLGLLHHVAQDEFNAGEVAGRRLIEAGGTRGLCINHAPGVGSTFDRCAGFRKALESAEAEFVGEVEVLIDNTDITKTRVEDFVNENANGDWTSLGMLSMGQALIPTLRQLANDHPEAVAGTFDTSTELGQALEANEVLFGIDQQPFLQGYSPILVLTLFAQTKQALGNHYLLSGPSLVLEAASPSEEQCKAEVYPVCLPPVEIEENKLGNLRILGYILGSVIVALSLVFAVIVFLYRLRPNIRQSQPFFLLMICLGGALMGSTIFPLAIDDDICEGNGCDSACMSAPWLFTLGFTFVFAALYSKLMRLNQLMKNAASFKHIQVTVADVLMPFTLQLTLNLAFLTTWTAADPMFYSRVEVSSTESYGICRLGDGGVSIAMAALIFSVNLLALIVALWEAYKARKVTYELSDGGSVTMVVVSIFQVAVVGVPILPLTRDDPQASFLLKTGLVFVISLSSLLFIFVPVFKKKGLANRAQAAVALSSRVNTINHPSGMFKNSSGPYDESASQFMSRTELETMSPREAKCSQVSEIGIVEESAEFSPQEGNAIEVSSFLARLVVLLRDGVLGRKDVMDAMEQVTTSGIIDEESSTTLIDSAGSRAKTSLKEVAGFIQTRKLTEDLGEYVDSRKDTPNHDIVVGVLHEYDVLPQKDPVTEADCGNEVLEDDPDDEERLVSSDDKVHLT